MFLRLVLRLQREDGLTLVELLAVTVIVSVLSLMAVQVYAEVTDRAKWAKSKEELRNIESALERYHAELGTYPDRLDDLVKRGYVNANTSFQTPWGSSRSKLYYFYAVDNASIGRSQAYALGDPGPSCATDSRLHSDVANALPCGRNPARKTFAFHVEPDLQLVGGGVAVISHHVTLRSFRTSCQGDLAPGFRLWSGCDLITES